MTNASKWIVLLALLGVAACQDNQYPVSGEECGPNDPVLEIDARDCTLPVTGTGL